MNPDIISNPKSERVRRVSGLARSQQRKKSERFLVEGPQSVREMVRWRPDAVVDCYAQVDDGDFSSDVVAAIVNASLAAGLYVHKVTAGVMRKISEDAQGIAAVGNMSAMQFETGVLTQASGASGSDLHDVGGGTAQDGVAGTVAAEASGMSNTIAAFWQVRDPGNAGTVIRAADASGCRAVVFVDNCVDRFNPKVIRSTAGSLFHLPVLTMDTNEFFAWASGVGAGVMAADVYGTPNTKPESLVDVVAKLRSNGSAAGLGADGGELGGTQRSADVLGVGGGVSAVLFGNEARGLPRNVLERVQRIVSIPIYGKAESLNLATSSAVMLYALAMA